MKRRELPVSTTVADAYRVVRRIGEGARGTVYEVQDLRRGQRCALKLMDGVIAESAEALATFHSQAEIASRPLHPQLLPVLDFGTADTGEPFVVTEFLDGEDLGAHRRRRSQRRPVRGPAGRQPDPAGGPGPVGGPQAGPVSPGPQAHEPVPGAPGRRAGPGEGAGFRAEPGGQRPAPGGRRPAGRQPAVHVTGAVRRAQRPAGRPLRPVGAGLRGLAAADRDAAVHGAGRDGAAVPGGVRGSPARSGGGRARHGAGGAGPGAVQAARGPLPRHPRVRRRRWRRPAARCR